MSSTRHRDVFFAHNGPGPYTCVFCSSEVTLEDVVIHHDDHVHKNNEPTNLKPCHKSCHHSHHAAGRTVEDSTREKIRQKRLGSRHTEDSKKKMRGRVITDEHRAKLSAALKGRPSPMKGRAFTDDHRANLSAAQQRRRNGGASV